MMDATRSLTKLNLNVRLMKYSVPVRSESCNGEIFYIVKRQIIRRPFSGNRERMFV